MTTKPSSSPAGSPPGGETLIEMTDSSGQALRLEQLIGKGGEGSVFAVHGQPALAAKVYHQTPIPRHDLEKLEAMIACRNADIDRIAAWPHSLLLNPHRHEPCGIVLPKFANALHMHDLYGTANRRRFFPDARWHHLVLAARNVAAAFDTMHAAGIVVGDVNQGNLLVDQQMCVRFIDCDSFQIKCGDRVFNCPVGTPHFTPPELQNKKLREVLRDPNHDRFGLAVLIFHLLFVGRHPFAGRYFGAGEMTIERAIAEGRFAFSRDKKATLMEPPPASLVLDDLPPGIGELFEGAFRPASADSGRPTAEQWAKRLDELIRQRATCSFDPTHIYYSRLRQCPWCRIEDEGGPAFFLADASTSMVSNERLNHLDARLKRLVIPVFPELDADELKIPQALRPKRLGKMPPLAAPDAGVGLLVLAAACCLAAAYSPWLLLAGTALSLAGGGLLFFSGEGKARRKRTSETLKRLGDLQRHLFRRAQAMTHAHQQRTKNFEKGIEELRTEQKNYRDADKHLKDILALHHVQQKNRYLAQHMLQDHVGRIRGLDASTASVLQSYGIESAADIDSMKLLGVPMLSPEMALELMAWRRNIEQAFVFRPEFGVGIKDRDVGGKTAVHRFKVGQSRRILIAATQLESIAQAAGDELRRELRDFDRVAQQAQEAVKELRQVQSSRREWERQINKSPAIIAASTAIPPVVGLIVWWLFG